MAAPVASTIRLPDDAGNAGKHVRTQTRVVGATTVHEHFFIQARQARIVSIYRLALVQSTVAAAAQNGTTAAMLFGHMPSAVSGKAMRLRRLAVTSQHSTALATPTAPRLLLRRFTSSGALSSGLLAPNLNDSVEHISPAALYSLVNTGVTVVHVGIGFASAALAGALTAVGAYEPCYKDMIDPASDTRKFNVQMLCDEVDIG